MKCNHKITIKQMESGKLFINGKYICDVDCSLLNKEIAKCYTDFSLINSFDVYDIINVGSEKIGKN